MDCPSCGRANASDRVECIHCEALLVDVFEPSHEKTDPMLSIGGATLPPGDDPGTDWGFTRLSPQTQYSGDLPRLFRFGNRYQVLEKLGEGGMGRVYKAIDLELDRPVALKTIRAEKRRGPEILKRFKQELVLARKITHKNVVRIYDLGEADGMKFFTMELVEGKSLRDVLRERKPVPVKEAISHLRQMLAGLAEAHRQGVVHRDLKPQNIMVDPEGGIRILDFGIARTADTTTLTGSDAMMGTPDYISPEQIKGDTATCASDLYSTGVILYELLTGEVPFKGDTPIAKVVARLQTKPAPPRSLNPEIPGYLERIVLKLMEVDPDLRYRTAEEVLEDLEREQVRSSLLLRTKKAILRKRAWIAAAGLAGALATGTWYYQTQTDPVASADVAVTTLAILPFHNLTGDADLGWMERGIPEMLITDILQSPSLRPLLADRVGRILEDLGQGMRTAFDDETLKVISEVAATEYTVHGRFIESENRLRIDLSLRDNATGVTTPIKVDGSSGEIFSLVDSITERLSAELDVNAFFGGNRPLAEVSTASLPAFQSYQLGLGELQQGRNLSAISFFKAAVLADPDFAMAHARLAEAHWNLGEATPAQTSILTATSLAAENPIPMTERFQIHAISARISDDPDTAVEAYSKLAQFFPSDPDIRLSLARALESKGNVDEALRNYEAIIALHPGYGAALLGLGRMLVTVDRSQEAIPFLERALASGEFENDGESLGMVHSILGVAYRSTNQHERALVHFDTSLEARRIIRDEQGVIATLINIAVARRQLRQYEEAARSLDSAVEAAREFGIPAMESAALFSIGNMALEMGRIDDALRHYKESLEIELGLNQENEIVYRLDAIAEAYRLSGHYVDAMVYLQEAKTRLDGIDEPSERAFNLSVLGHIKAARGKYDEAIQAFLTAIPPLEPTEQFRDLASARRMLIDIYKEQGRFAEALQVIRQGLDYFDTERGGYLATTKVQYAELLMALGDYGGAEQELRSIRELVPDLEWEGRRYYGYVQALWLISENAAGAVELLSAAAEDNPSGGDALLTARASVAMGRLLIESGQARTGRAILERSISEARRLKHPARQAAASIALAEHLIAEGDLSSAQEVVSEAKELAAAFQGRLLLLEANYNLARIARARHEWEAAGEAQTEARTVLQWVSNQVPAPYQQAFGQKWRHVVELGEN